MASVAAAALLLAAPHVTAQTVPPAAPCSSVSGTTVTCTGDIATGVSITSSAGSPTPFTVLEVKDLTADIAPAAEVDGIRFLQDDPLAFGGATVISNMGAHDIRTTGGAGIYVSSFSEGAPVTVISRGDISVSGSAAIFASGSGAVTVDSTGDLSGNSGIVAQGRRSAKSLDVSSNGVITAVFYGVLVNQPIGTPLHLGPAVATITTTGKIVAGRTGIEALGSYMVVDLRNSAEIEAGTKDGIYVRTRTGGEVTLQNTGNITVLGESARGIFAMFQHRDDLFGPVGALSVSNSGAITHPNSGAIASPWIGLYAKLCGNLDGACAGATGGGNFTVSNTGQIGTAASPARLGIAAYHYGSGTFDITNEGNIYATNRGIRAVLRGSGGSFLNTGDIRAVGSSAYGMHVRLDPRIPAGPTTFTNTGDITASWAGLRLRTTGESESLSVTNTGKITSLTWNAISASGSRSPLTVTNSGELVAGSRTANGSTNHYNGIDATASRNLTIANTGSISAPGNGISASTSTYTYTGVANAGILVTSSGAIAAGEEGVSASAYGKASSVTIRQTGGSITSAARAAILTGSLDGDIAIEIGGTTTGGSGYAAAQMGFSRSGVFDGRDNTLSVTSTGTLRNAGGVGELAVLGRSGNEAVRNAGTVTGNVDLGTGTNSFANLAGGTFNMGTSVVLGAASTLSSAGTLSPGGTGVVVTSALTGNLVLDPASQLAFDLGAAEVAGGPLNDLLSLTGDLTLDGTLRVAQSPGGSFTTGVYRLIDYGGSLTDNGLSILGLLPGLSGTIQTEIAGQVNLIVSGGAPVDVGYWDGPHDSPGNVAGGRGGAGVWNAASTNWTTPGGDANGAWDAGLGVFAGETGTVTVEGLQSFTGLQFVTDDYHLVAGAGGALGLGSGAFISVDPNIDATIAVGIGGDGALSKQGAGTLVLSATDSAVGGLGIEAGKLVNQGQMIVGGSGSMDPDTVLTNTSGAELRVAGGITGDSGAQAIDNAGLLQAAVGLGGGDDLYRLRATGTQVGAVDGGAGRDALALDAGAAGRTISQGGYVNFEDLTVNGDDGASGRVVLAGAASPARQATLDLGPTGTARLAAGELNLASATSSLRAGVFTTAAGTRLSGNGAVIGDLAMAGVIAPGNSIGTLTVAGGYEQTGSYEAEISDAAGDLPGVRLSDRIVTTGPVSFGGTVAVAVADGSSLDAIKAAGRSQGAMRWRILDGDTAIATDQRTARLAAPQGLALGLDYANGGEDVDLFMTWAAPRDVPKQAGLLWQLALEPDFASCDVADMAGAGTSCAFLQGDALSLAADGGAGDATGWSGVAGGGGRVTPELWLGAAASYGAGDLGSGDYDRYAAYLWGRWTSGGAEIKGYAGLGHYAVDGQRSTTSGDTASLDYGAWQPYLAAEARYWTNVTQSLAVTPLAGVTSSWLELPGHGESDAGIEDFHAHGETLWGLTTTLGCEARWQATPDLTLEASAGWQHLFGDDGVTITGSYDGIPGAELAGRSKPVDRNGLALGAALLLPLADTALLRLDYDASLAGNQVTQSAAGRITVTW